MKRNKINQKPAIEIKMISTCAYCQASFTSARVTKKYCSDTCKQMAYFIRNGLVLAGVNSDVPFTQTKNETDGVKYTTQNDTVKYGANDNKDKDIEQLLNRFTQAMEQKFMATIDTVKQELALKYDKLILQQETILKCDNTIEKNSQGEEELFTEPIAFNTYETHQPINSPEPAHTETKNETEPEKETTFHQIIKEEQTNNVLPEAKKIIEQEEDDTPYKWIESKLIRYIDQKYMNENISLKLLEPLRHWDYEKAQHINWVNIRLRCLIESLIRLSNYSRIDTHTILCVNDAFNCLVKSNAYKNLPDNYPYKELIAELALKVTEIAAKNKNETQLIFRLPAMRKAQLLTIRYQMLTNVPAIKFSELDFTEEGNSLKTIKPNNEEDDEKKEKPKIDWGRKLRAIKRERERNKAA